MFSFDFYIEGKREAPVHIKNFNGFFKGAVRILNCTAYPKWENVLRTLSFYNMISMNPCFIYRCFSATVKNGVIEPNKNSTVIVIGWRTEIGQEELDYLYEETYYRKPNLNPLKKIKTEEPQEKLDAESIQLAKIVRIAPQKLEDFPKFTVFLKTASDVFRLQYIQLLSLYFVNKKGKLSDEQRSNIRLLKTETLELKCKMLKEEPWLLAFREKSEPLAPLVLNQFERAVAEFKLEIPLHVKRALSLYYVCAEAMYETNCTVFEWKEVSRKAINVLEYDGVAPLVIEFLEKYAVTWLDVEKTIFSFKSEYADAKRICRGLMKTAKNASKQQDSIELRGEFIPTNLPVLTSDQSKIAQHILNHYLTVVQGLPGTGKTVLVEWVFCQFKNVLLCTLTGMMTRSLRARMGNRQESAYTIDYLVHVAMHKKEGAKWLKEMEVLVVDEFSNTPTKSLGWLLQFLPNLKRIVFVGDCEQIGSIAPGDVMYDIVSFYGSCSLTEILRVRPELKDLCMAPTLISNGLHRKLVFKDEGPMTLIQPVKTENGTKQVLNSILDIIFKEKKSLMNHQIVVLQNDIRHSLNRIYQDICIERKIIKPKPFYRIGKNEYYIGSKITFLENYNKATKHTVAKNVEVTSDIISNGETGIITSIQTYDHFFYIGFVDDDFSKSKAIQKFVLVGTEVGVKPFHMDLGYATTTTKVQGREFPFCIFWNNTNPALCWTRAHVYVALSRGKERVWCVSTVSDLYAICERPNKRRSTILSCLLEICREKLLGNFTTVPIQLKKFNHYKILPLTIPCIPVLQEKKKEDQEENE